MQAGDGKERTVVRLDVVARFERAVLVLEVANPESKHQAIEQAMHDLEPCSSAAEDSSDPTDVARLALDRSVLDDDVADLENAERKGMLAVLADRLEHAGEERRSHDLVLDRLGVGEDDGDVSRVFSVQELEVLVVRDRKSVV